MLILIPGATGNLGKNLVHSALRRGHRVRALGRSPSKFTAEIREQLESFVEIRGFNDTDGLDIGCKGVDAVIVAYNADPTLALDGQLALLRAAERAGVKRFHAMSWNLDWENMELGIIESYDALISFRRQAMLTSPIKPLYVFCGVLAMTLFGSPGAGALEGKSAMWVRIAEDERAIKVIGTGDAKLQYSVEADVADFSVAITTAEGAEEGGIYRFCSDEFSPKTLADVYEQVRGKKCSVDRVMDLETCRALITKTRKEASDANELYSRWKDVIGLVYGLYIGQGSFLATPLDAARFSDVPRTSVKDYIRDNEWV